MTKLITSQAGAIILLTLYFYTGSKYWLFLIIGLAYTAITFYLAYQMDKKAKQK